MQTEAVLDFQVFDFRTTHYRFSPPISLLYNEFGLLYTADEQTSRAIAEWCCLSAKLTLQSLYMGLAILLSVFIQLCLFLHEMFSNNISTTPSCSHSSNVFFPPILPHIPPTFPQCLGPVAYRGGGLGCSNPLPKIPKALQNRAKLNPIVKTVKNC